MEEIIKKLIDKIIDELAEKGRIEIEIRGTLDKHGEKIHNLELILKDKVEECEFESLKERILILEQEVKSLRKINTDKGKNRLAWLALYGTIIGTIIAGIFELIKHLIIKD